MIIRSGFARPGRAAMLAAMMTALALAGCGSDTSKTEGTTIALDVAKGVKSRYFGKKSAGPAKVPDPARMAESAMRLNKGPLILAQIEKSGLLTILGEFGENGATRTYATPGKQSLSLRRGVLIATRGLGNDLMSSEADASIALILGRRSGEAARTYRYLDGEDIERPLPMQCSYTTGPSKSFDFAGTRYDTVQVDETCVATVGTLTIQNNYWVTGSGTVALSRQWIGVALGHVTIQLVRN